MDFRKAAVIIEKSLWGALALFFYPSTSHLYPLPSPPFSFQPPPPWNIPTSKPKLLSLPRHQEAGPRRPLKIPLRLKLLEQDKMSGGSSVPTCAFSTPNANECTPSAEDHERLSEGQMNWAPGGLTGSSRSRPGSLEPNPATAVVPKWFFPETPWTPPKFSFGIMNPKQTTMELPSRQTSYLPKDLMLATEMLSIRDTWEEALAGKLKFHAGGLFFAP